MKYLVICGFLWCARGRYPLLDVLHIDNTYIQTPSSAEGAGVVMDDIVLSPVQTGAAHKITVAAEQTKSLHSRVLP